MSRDDSMARADVTVRPGDDQPVTLDNVPTTIIQALYREITGKTEKMSRQFQRRVVIKLEDLRQLVYRLTQTLEQYDVIEKNVSITLSHDGDDTLKFSSFERFTLYDQTKTSPIKYILITYEFLLKAARTEKHFNYKLNVAISPFVLSEIDDASSFNIPLSVLIGPTVVAELEYVDYVVARSLLSAVDDWDRSLERLELGSSLSWMSKNRGKFTLPMLFIGGIASILPCYILRPAYLPNAARDFEMFSTWSIFSAGWVLFSLLFYVIIVSMLDGALLPLGRTSVTLINAGDQRNFQELKRRVRGRFLFIAGICGAIILHILADISAKAILESIHMGIVG